MAVLETPWFMKTKTSDLGRINKVFDERFQASIALIQMKKRKTLMKIDEEMKQIKGEFKHIRSEVDFSTDLDVHGMPIDEITCKQKASGQDYWHKHGKHLKGMGGHRTIPPELEKERQRYLKLRQRDRRRELTMVELRNMCYNCIRVDTGDDANRYIQRARKVLFPKEKVTEPLRTDSKTDKEEETPRFSKYDNDGLAMDTDKSQRLRMPKLETDFGKNVLGGITTPSERVPIRPSSAASSISQKPTLPRFKTIDVVGSSDIPSALGLITSVSI